MKHTLNKLTVVEAFILSLSIWGCSKKDYTPYQDSQSAKNAAVVKKFLTIPDNASLALKNLIKDWAKSEEQYHFTATFLAKNGMPVWDKIASNLSITTAITHSSNSLQTFGTSTYSGKYGIFFIPFVNTVSKEVKTMVVCLQTDTAYQYYVYNKSDLLKTHPTDARTLQNGKTLLGMIASFENTINNKKNVQYPAPYNFDYSNARIVFSKQKPTNITTSNYSVLSNNLVTFATPCPVYVTAYCGSDLCLYTRDDCNGGAVKFIQVLLPGDGGGGTGDDYPPIVDPPTGGSTGTPDPNTPNIPGMGYGGGTGGNGSTTTNPPNYSDGDPQNPFWTVEGDNDNTPTENSIFFEAADQANAVDINKMMKCFDNILNAGATYQVKLCVDVPVNDNPSELWTGLQKAGHVFVSMTKTNGSQSVTQSFGFYPLNTLSAIEMGPVTSAIVNDGANPPHEYNASITMPNIPAGAFQALITAAKSYSTRNYALSNYNCAGFALDVFNTIRATDLNSVHKTEQIKKFGVYVSVGFTQSPSGLYETLANMKNTGGSEAQNIEIGVVKPAASSKGECN